MKALKQIFKTSFQYDFVRRLIKDLTTYEKPVYVLIVGQFLNKFGAFVFPFLSLFLQDRDYSRGEITLVFAALSSGGLLGPLVAGYLSDSIGRRNTLVISLVGSSISLVALYFCSSFGCLVVVSSIHGFASFLFGAPANALMTDLVPEEKRVTAFALFRLALNAGFAAGPALAGMLYQKSPFLIFIGDASTTLVFALIAFLWLPHGLRTIKGKISSFEVIARSWKEAFTDLFKHGPMIQFMVTGFLISMCFLQVFDVLSLASTDNGLTVVQYGLVMAFNGLLIVIVEFPLCQWLQTLEYKKVIISGYMIFAIGTASFFFAETMTGYIIAMGIFTLGEIVTFPISMAYMGRLTPEKLRGRYFGIKGMTWGVAGMIGSAGIWVHGKIDDQLWLWAGGLALLAGVVMLFSFKDRRGVNEQ